MKAERREKRCSYCGAPPHSTRRLDAEHIDGHEVNGSPANVTYACRSCNVKKAQNFKRHKLGTKTVQYNPAYPKGCGPGPKNKRAASSLREYVWAINTVLGRTDASCTDVRKAASLIAHTSASQRSDYAREIWEIRKTRGT